MAEKRYQVGSGWVCKACGLGGLGAADTRSLLVSWRSIMAGDEIVPHCFVVLFSCEADMVTYVARS